MRNGINRLLIGCVVAGLPVGGLIQVAAGREVRRVAINDYFAMDYRQEPVSVDVRFDQPVRAEVISLVQTGTHAQSPAPCQVEVIEGTSEAVRAARVWTLVNFPFVPKAGTQGREPAEREAPGREPDTGPNRQIIVSVRVDEPQPAAPSVGAIACRPDGVFAGPGASPLLVLDNGVIRVRTPGGSQAFDPPIRPVDVPGPVVSLARGSEPWVGTGYLDAMPRVTRLDHRLVRGAVYVEVESRYTFEGGAVYRSTVRLFAGKPYVKLDEDFNVGGGARFVFNFDDWLTDAYFRCGDSSRYGWSSVKDNNPCGDYVQFDGQKALSRLVVWSQFNYFSGKQEIVGLKTPDPASIEAHHAEQVERWNRERARYRTDLDRYEADQKAYDDWKALSRQDPKTYARGPREPRRPTPPPETPPERPLYAEEDHALGGAALRTGNLVTPPGTATAIGAFYARPDRWTRAKVNHVDLQMRPEVPGERSTRGVAGLDGARLRIALEAWLVDGHREWALFAVPAADRDWLTRAPVVEGVWPLDRIARLTLVWNSDGTAPALEDTAPQGVVGEAGVLKGVSGRSGLQYFNGSNPHIRQVQPPADASLAVGEPLMAATADRNRMVGTAMMAYMASDDSAYPSLRAMLPWTDPEALNPFYQGMENMNFNADLYRFVATHGFRLARMGHPEARRFIDHAVQSLDRALDVYVYPESGCWEESHGYAGHTLRVLNPLMRALAGSGVTNFFEDVRVARMAGFFMQVLAPFDPEFGTRIVPPVGDHGLSRDGPKKRFGDLLPLFAGARNPEVRRIAGEMAWLVRADGGDIPAGLEPVRPDLRSRWLRGYGSVLRARAAGDDGPETFCVVRAGQSWGHHHEDKGSLWFWGRHVPFFGDASWGTPPGSTYGNPYKQGPASGTQIEFKGISNWPLPCKYAAAWIADECYSNRFDYVLARNLYPFNPRLDLTRSTPVAFQNGYDRQVLLLHPDVLIVRDNVESAVPTVWRLHSYQPQGTVARGATATLTSERGVAGHLTVLSPSGAVLKSHAVIPPLDPASGQPYALAGESFKTSLMLEWPMPENTSATWAFAVHDVNAPAPRVTAVEPQGRVTRVELADGTSALVLLNGEPFTFDNSSQWTFTGTVGVVFLERDGRETRVALRGAFDH